MFWRLDLGMLIRGVGRTFWKIFASFFLLLCEQEMMNINKYPSKILCVLQTKVLHTQKYIWIYESAKILINVYGVGRTRTESLLHPAQENVRSP